MFHQKFGRHLHCHWPRASDSFTRVTEPVCRELVDDHTVLDRLVSHPRTWLSSCVACCMEELAVLPGACICWRFSQNDLHTWQYRMVCVVGFLHGYSSLLWPLHQRVCERGAGSHIQHSRCILLHRAGVLSLHVCCAVCQVSTKCAQ
jgi:hypothetical protein